MNHSGSGHLKGMVLLMGGLFIAMRVFGVSTGDALVYAAVLACPLMMVMMMFGAMEDMAIRGPRKRRRPWTMCSRTAPVTTPTVDTGTDWRSSGADWPHPRQARSSRFPGAR